MKKETLRLLNHKKEDLKHLLDLMVQKVKLERKENEVLMDEMEALENLVKFIYDADIFHSN